MQMLGKLYSRNNLSSSLARVTDLTKITTCDITLVVGECIACQAYLVKLQLIQEIIQLPVLCVLVQLNIVLLQTVQSQLAFIINEDFERLKWT